MKYEFNINIKRTNRIKTVSFFIKEQKLIITVPKFISDSEIDSLILSKIKWIRKKLAAELLEKSFKKKKYIDGENFMYFGNYYRLNIKKSMIEDIKISSGKITIFSKNIKDKIYIKNLLKKWFIEESIKYLNKTTSYYEKLIGVNVSKLLFGEYKSKWGSCNSKKRVSYDWRIIMAPLEVIHYLVIHELSHINHPNHSKHFWLHVEKYMKDYKTHRRWLKLNAGKLII